MISNLNGSVQFHDAAPATENLRSEVLRGLQQARKQIPCKFLYDRRGSMLFDQICELDEYYPTRTELRIMHCHVREMASLIGPRSLLIEYGSGSGLKTDILLNRLKDLAAYVPIDISRQCLEESAIRLASSHPGLEILPVCADYTRPFDLPTSRRRHLRRIVYFPGSTIGNFEPREAVHFLRHIASVCGHDGGLLIGVDLKKDPMVLHQAYNDPGGVTAEFNLNLLARINRELSATFELDQFRHYAFYNPRIGRIEMHLASLANQSACIDDTEIAFKKGESIHTESSYKYNPDDFAALTAEAGFVVRKVWMPENEWFSVQYLTLADLS